MGLDRWGGGWFYNPDDGKTYNVSAELRYPDLIVPPHLLGIPLVGKVQTLLPLQSRSVIPSVCMYHVFAL